MPQLRSALAVRTWAAYADTRWPGSRDAQQPPDGDWLAWLILAGRGFGKTRTGVEWAIRQAVRMPRGALVAPTKPDVRDVLVEGESGVLACAPPGFRPLWEPSKRRLTYPNGAIQTTYSADEPDRLRGPQHHYAYADEWMAMRDPEALIDMLLLGLRLGSHPRLCITTTPKPQPVLKRQIEDQFTRVTSGSTYDNLDNLAPPFRRQVLARYEGTRLGRQELHAEILSDIEGALFSAAWLHRAPIPEQPTRVVTGVDPAATAGPDSDETGIVTAARTGDEFVVLSDRSGRYTPDEWASIVAYEAQRWESDLIVAERNQGGDMVRRVLNTVDQPTRVKLIHAKRGKALRAEPIAALYEQGKVGHADGLAMLENQITEWVPGVGDSPDRLDAMVYALTELSGRALAPVQSMRT